MSTQTTAMKSDSIPRFPSRGSDGDNAMIEAFWSGTVPDRSGSLEVGATDCSGGKKLSRQDSEPRAEC